MFSIEDLCALSALVDAKLDVSRDTVGGKYISGGTVTLKGAVARGVSDERSLAAAIGAQGTAPVAVKGVREQANGQKSPWTKHQCAAVVAATFAAENGVSPGDVIPANLAGRDALLAAIEARRVVLGSAKEKEKAAV